MGPETVMNRAHVDRLTAIWIALYVLACGATDPRSEDGDDGPAPPVEAVRTRSGSLPLEERLNGLVKARNQVEVRPEIAAPVVAVLVDSGDAVERGQPLVRLDGETLGQQLRQVEASLRLAEAQARESRARIAELSAQVVRSRSLAEQELISILDLETQEAQLAAAEANAEQAEARVEEARATVDERRTASARTVVRSPVAGRVGQRRVEVGMLVDPGTLLFRVGDLDRVIVEVPLSEGMLDDLEVGQTALVRPRGGDAEPLRATLSRISPFLEDGSFSTTGEIDVDNKGGRLRPGMFVTVDVLYGESQQATLAPASALWDDPASGVLGVYVVAGMPDAEPDADAPPELSEKAHGVELRPVEVLATGRGTVGLRGVEADEWVVTVGQHLLAGKDDATARVRPATWERVLGLQSLQREDLLRGFMAKQRRLARTLGAGIPAGEDFLGGGATRAAPGTEDG